MSLSELCRQALPVHMLCVYLERGGPGGVTTDEVQRSPTPPTPHPTRHTPVVFSRGLTDAVAVTVISCSLTLSHWATGAAPAAALGLFQLL